MTEMPEKPESDVSTTSLPDAGPPSSSPDLRDFLSAAGVDESYVGECVSILQAWKDGDTGPMSEFMDKKSDDEDTDDVELGAVRKAMKF